MKSESAESFKDELEDSFQSYEEVRLNDVELCCDPAVSECAADDKRCLSLSLEYEKLTNSSATMKSKVTVTEECTVQYTEYEPCAVIKQNQQSDKLQQG